MLLLSRLSRKENVAKTFFGEAEMCEKSEGEKWKVGEALQSRERLQKGTVLTTPNTR